MSVIVLGPGLVHCVPVGVPTVTDLISLHTPAQAILWPLVSENSSVIILGGP